MTTMYGCSVEELKVEVEKRIGIAWIWQKEGGGSISGRESLAAQVAIQMISHAQELAHEGNTETAQKILYQAKWVLATYIAGEAHCPK